MNNARDNLDRVFDVIGYTKDKEMLYESFLNISYLNAVNNLVQSLPDSNRERVAEEIKSITDPKLLVETAIKHFGEKKVGNAFKDSLEKILLDYIQSIKDSLSEQQLNDIEKISLSSSATSL